MARVTFFDAKNYPLAVTKNENEKYRIKSRKAYYIFRDFLTGLQMHHIIVTFACCSDVIICFILL